MRSAQAGLSRPHAEIDLLLSKELEETARQKALVGDPRLDSLSAEGPTFRWRTPKPGKMHFGSLAPQNSTPQKLGGGFILLLELPTYQCALPLLLCPCIPGECCTKGANPQVGHLRKPLTAQSRLHKDLKLTSVNNLNQSRDNL